MLKGTCIAKELAESMKEEIDVSLPEISIDKYYMWINSELYHIYSSVVKSLGVNTYIITDSSSLIDLSNPAKKDDTDIDLGFDISVVSEEKTEPEEYLDDIVFEDIYKFYDDQNREYVKTTMNGSKAGLKYHYFKVGNKVGFYADDNFGIYSVVYYKRPGVITKDNASTYVIPLPDAFVDVIRARIRREAFLLSGDIAISNAWAEEHSRLISYLADWFRGKEAYYVR